MAATTSHHRTTASKPQKVVATTCSRCGGLGYYPTRAHGACFRCGGNGSDPTAKEWAFPTDWTDDQIAEYLRNEDAKKDAARERRQSKRDAERADNIAANLAACPALAEAEPAFDSGEIAWGRDFLADIFWKGCRNGKRLTDNQIAAFEKAWAEHKQRAADKQTADDAAAEAAGELAEGRYQIEGEIISTKWVDNAYGGTLKMLVVFDNGIGEVKVWGTRPTGLHGRWDDEGDYIEGADRGDIVRFTATVERSHDDSAFGFFKQPRNAEIVRRGE